MAAGPEAEGAGRHAGHREDSTRSTGRTARGAQGRCSPAGCEDSTQSTGKVLPAGCEDGTRSHREGAPPQAVRTARGATGKVLPRRL